VTITIYNGTTAAGASARTGTGPTSTTSAPGDSAKVVAATAAPTSTRQYSLRSSSGGVRLNETTTVK